MQNTVQIPFEEKDMYTNKIQEKLSDFNGKSCFAFTSALRKIPVLLKTL